MFPIDGANLMKSNLSVDIFVQTESDENEFKYYKAMTKVFLSSRSPAWCQPMSLRCPSKMMIERDSDILEYIAVCICTFS